jgi:hypothetical protein
MLISRQKDETGVVFTAFGLSPNIKLDKIYNYISRNYHYFNTLAEAINYYLGPQWFGVVSSPTSIKSLNLLGCL